MKGTAVRMHVQYICMYMYTCLQSIERAGEGEREAGIEEEGGR